MRVAEPGDSPEEPLSTSREGEFDAQLSFPAPFVEAPQPITTIIKRDGHEAPFEKSKIAEAIFRAAQSIGGQDRDRADSLASGVTIYLMKQLKGRPPTVEQVHDAVEKVLIEMGHARTALAYARYRDRRGRVRQLHAGNIRRLLKELAEAEGALAPVTPPGEMSLFVRTSGGAVVTWDRARIVQALVRETDLDESVAGVIALDVEKQILAANVRTLTASLVRELVDAKLIELGLEEHRRRHARLGVPLYDAEQILCMPNSGPQRALLDPESTNDILAERVKREYALNRVFCQETGDAHLRGDIHLAHLGDIDRLHSIAASIEHVKMFGVSEYRAPRTVDALLSQLAVFTGQLQNHFSEAVSWQALNFYLAPCVRDAEPATLRGVARTLIFLLSHLGQRPGRSTPDVRVGVNWDAPPSLSREEAIGWGVTTGATYAACAGVARQLAWALLEVVADAPSDAAVQTSPRLDIRISHEFFRTPGHEEFLVLASRAAVAGRAAFLFDRNVLPERARERPWQPWRTAVHAVGLNMPRLAFDAGGEQGVESALEEVLEVAVRAHREKVAFLGRLMALQDAGPLSVLTRLRDGKPLVSLDETACLIYPVGLAGCVHAVSGSAIHESEHACAFAVRLVERLKTLCDRRSEREGIKILPVQLDDVRAAARFAEMDLADRPLQAKVLVEDDPSGQRVAYSPGAGVETHALVSPIERVRLEGRLHEWLEVMTPTVVRLPDSEVSAESLASFVRKAFFHTSSAGIVVEATP